MPQLFVVYCTAIVSYLFIIMAKINYTRILTFVACWEAMREVTAKFQVWSLVWLSFFELLTDDVVFQVQKGQVNA